jgi:hypothetical protein
MKSFFIGARLKILWKIRQYGRVCNREHPPRENVSQALRIFAKANRSAAWQFISKTPAQA